MSDNTTPGQDTSHGGFPSESADGQSRRRFLKAAVVGSAAVAAVGSASAAGLALANKGNPLQSIRFGQAITLISPNDPCAVCTTGTNPSNFVDQDTFNNSESIALWVRFINVPAGAYTIDVTPTIQAKNSACNTSKPLQYQSAHNAVSSWVLPAGGFACHPTALSDLPSPTQSDSLPASFTISKTQDLMVLVHVQNGCPGARDITITGTLTGPTSMQCSHLIHIKA